MSGGMSLSTRCAITVRPCALDELDRLLEFRARALADAPDAFRQTLAEHTRVSPSAWREFFEARRAAGDAALIAEACGSWVGMVFAMREEDGGGRIGGMWVAPQARGRQAGRALLNAALAWFRAADVRHVRLCVAADNAVAGTLYRSAGFSPTGETCALRPGSPVRVEELELELPPKSMRCPPPSSPS